MDDRKGSNGDRQFFFFMMIAVVTARLGANPKKNWHEAQAQQLSRRTSVDKLTSHSHLLRGKYEALR